jgi:hypothetical protein
VVVFKDKPHYRQHTPADFLSPRALENRQRHNISVTEEDYPIDASYIASVLRQDTAIVLITRSKWLNYIVVSCQASCLDSIRRLPFVKSATELHTVDHQNFMEGKHFKEIVPDRIQDVGSQTAFSVDTAYYGVMFPQIKRHNGHLLHHAGYKGKGVLIAVLDAGYGGLYSPMFESLHRENRLLGNYDFVKESHDMFSVNQHGMSVMSLMAGKIPYTAVGTAPEAQYVIMKTEANNYEEILEEYFLVAGLECADSLGADVVNISLGYTSFRSVEANHSFSHLDGLHSVASIAVTLAVEKGIVVSNSAGNEGDKSWKYISIPADACNVLSVAAVRIEGEAAAFSSRGSASLGSIKPNIASIGWDTYVVKANGTIGKGNGTSLSSPINTGLAACLRQAFPQKTSHEIIKVVLESCNHVQNPDTLTGYGIPDYWLAYRLLDATNVHKKEVVQIYPNPLQSTVTLKAYYPSTISGLDIIDVWGRTLYSFSCNNLDHLEINVPSLSFGVYFFRIHTSEGIIIKKAVNSD